MRHVIPQTLSGYIHNSYTHSEQFREGITPLGPGQKGRHFTDDITYASFWMEIIVS